MWHWLHTDLIGILFQFDCLNDVVNLLTRSKYQDINMSRRADVIAFISCTEETRLLLLLFYYTTQPIFTIVENRTKDGSCTVTCCQVKINIRGLLQLVPASLCLKSHLKDKFLQLELHLTHPRRESF